MKVSRVIRNLVVGGICMLLFGDRSAEAVDVAVGITQSGIFPAILTIRQGDTVVWTNNSVDVFDVIGYTAGWRGQVSNYSRLVFSNRFEAWGEYPYKVEESEYHTFGPFAGVIKVLKPAAGDPQVMLNAPFSGLETTVGGVYLVASRTDSSTNVARMEFRADGTNILGTVTNAPYRLNRFLGTFAYDTIAEHLLTATAFDNEGNAVTSSPVRVVVYPAQHLSAPRVIRPGVFFFDYSCPDDGRRSWSLQTSSNLEAWTGCGTLNPHYGTIAIENATNAMTFYRIIFCP